MKGSKQYNFEDPEYAVAVTQRNTVLCHVPRKLLTACSLTFCRGLQRTYLKEDLKCTVGMISLLNNDFTMPWFAFDVLN